VHFDLFQDIVERTGGDIYLGVVGPVRTGKSTFIRKFMEKVVLPNIEDQNELQRARDELPQGSGGRTIMTTEPKFIPDEAIELTLMENINMRVRFVDCVGYTVEGALGYEDEGSPRMVSTPWFEHDIPFEEAAEIGTRKVITDHSTIGIVVTTDGSITELNREGYVDAEERVISELKEIGKPFVVLLNSTNPESEDALLLRDELVGKYKVPVIPINCLELQESDIDLIVEEILYEFPVREVNVNLPNWLEVLEDEHWLRENFNEAIKENMAEVSRLRDVEAMVEKIKEYAFVGETVIEKLELGTGEATVRIEPQEQLFDQVVTEICGKEITDKADLLKTLIEFSHAKAEYDKVSEALEQVKNTGYGIVPPLLEEMTLDEPEIIRQGGRFGVRLRASAPSLHIIKVNVKSEFTPIVGSEKQSEELVNFLTEEFEENPRKLWGSNIFGKSLYDVVQDGIANKLGNIPPNAQEKLQNTLEKIINEGSGGLIAIIL
jgi:stage IV sporulation protein A